MGQKVEVSGTGYVLKGGKPLIGGTAYAIKKGRTLIGGTGYDIALQSGTPISELQVGSIVKTVVDGTLRDFLIVHQGLPGAMYDDSCNGAWLLMKECIGSSQWNLSGTNNYNGSTAHNYLNSEFLNLFESSIKDVIKQVKIPYRMNGGYGSDQSGANGLSCKSFLLSAREVGVSLSYSSREGNKLDYFEWNNGEDSKRIAYLDNHVVGWWLRSSDNDNGQGVMYIGVNGSSSSMYANYSNSFRPAFILPSTLLVSDDGVIMT